ncbi:MAG TPA: PCRF domain-containing protein, partial [Clostridiales bacterium]|nr:PCRF domain-containing protein [Clostridiales bacterium]
MFEKLAKVEEHFASIDRQLAEPAVVSDMEKYTALLKERKQLEPLVEKYQAYKKAEADATEAKELLTNGGLDSDFKALVSEEWET